MKITIDIDCTPEEAREFLGLPDVQPMHRAVMATIQAQVEKQLANADPEQLMKTWVVPGMEMFSQFQQAMWKTAMSASPDPDDKKGR